MPQTEVKQYSTIITWTEAGVYTITQRSTLAAAVQIVGGPLTLEQSNDGVNWHTVVDIRGDDVEGAGFMAEISVSSVYLRVSPAEWPSGAALILSVRG